MTSSRPVHQHQAGEQGCACDVIMQGMNVRVTSSETVYQRHALHFIVIEMKFRHVFFQSATGANQPKTQLIAQSVIFKRLLLCVPSLISTVTTTRKKTKKP